MGCFNNAKRRFKILVFSDTHGRCDDSIFVINSQKDVDMVIHAGDYVSDAEDLSYIFSDIRFEYVRGNNDFLSHERDEKIIEACGFKIFLTHGHEYGVKCGLQKLCDKAAKLGCKIAIFGHTHQEHYEQRDGIYLLNPGACAGRYATYGVIEIFENNFKIEIVKF